MNPSDAAASSDALPVCPAPPLVRSRTTSASDIIGQTEVYVQSCMSSNDGSHDWFHVDRIRRLALQLAQEEAEILQPDNPQAYWTDEELQIIELSALLHDIHDWKYTKKSLENPQKVEEFSSSISHFLYSIGLSEENSQLIEEIVENIGFKRELSGIPVRKEIYRLFSIVSDADRLDAIGAIGIARTFTFGGARGRSIADASIPPAIDENTTLTVEMYEKLHHLNKSPTLNHFYEKLFHLSKGMKSEAGKRKSRKRHEFMIEFIKQIHGELEGKW